MVRQSLKAISLAVLVLLLGLTAAHAVPMLRLSDGAGNSVIITDEVFVPGPGAPADSFAGAGTVAFVGSLSGNPGASVWTVNVTTGLTNVALGINTPHLDLNSVNVSSTGGGTLTIEFTETGFGPSAFGFTSAIGGTTNGTVTAASYADAGNAAFAQTTLIASHGPFSPIAFSDTQGAPAVAGSPFSLTQVVNITHTSGGQNTSFDFELSTVPEPGSMLLLGSGLASCGYLFRRKREERDS